MTAIRLWNKGGERWVEAHASSSTPRATPTCARWPASPTTRRGDGGTIQSLSTLFKVANVDIEAASAVKKAELWARMAEAASSGAYALPRIEGSWHRTPYEGVALIHMTRIPNVDATDPEQLTRAEVEGRRQVQEYHRFLRDRVPGLRAVGDRRDVARHRRPGEPPGPRRPPADPRGRAGRACGSTTRSRCAARRSRTTARAATRRGSTSATAGSTAFPTGRCCRSGVEGLLVAGRCFSATHDAHASARSMATCMAMGQAAGTAAVMAAAGGTVPRAVPAGLLRERLALDGALLEPVEAGDGVLASSGRP